MNKTEVLVALLEKARQWERPDGTPRVPPLLVVGEMGDALRRLEVTTEGADEQAQVLIIGAAVVYLLTDEVEVVQGRELDEWLAEQMLTGFGDPLGRITPQVGGYVPLGLPTVLPREPINGQIGRQL